MCECTDRTYDRRTGTEVCINCAEVFVCEGEVEKDWFKHQDSVYYKPAPYKYSRQTHFRKTLERVLGHSPLDGDVLEKCRKALEGYPNDFECMFQVLKESRLPYQHTNTVRRRLGYDVPSLTCGERMKMIHLFDAFCTVYEEKKPNDRKNLPSIDYLIYSFLMKMGRGDVARMISKKESSLNCEEVIESIFNELVPTQTSSCPGSERSCSPKPC